MTKAEDDAKREEETARITAAAAIAVVSNDIEHIKGDISEIKVMLNCTYVTMAEFKPVRAIVYGMVGTVCLAVLGALITLVVLRYWKAFQRARRGWAPYNRNHFTKGEYS